MKTIIPVGRRSSQLLAKSFLIAAAVLSTSGCTAIVGGLLESALDSHSERRYERDGATPKQAKQMVFEDHFFEDVGGRP